jgi:hypothetical protein
MDIMESRPDLPTERKPGAGRAAPPCRLRVSSSAETSAPPFSPSTPAEQQSAKLTDVLLM